MADEGGGGGVPDWILTYGDMMSLLLCFFVLLYSLAGEKTATQDQIIESIIKQFGDSHDLAMFYLRKQLNAVGKPGKAVSENDNGKLRQKHANQSQPGAPGDRSRVTDVRDGKRLTIGAPIYFDPGNAALTLRAKESVLAIADELRGKFHLVEVRGFEPPTLPAAAVEFKDTMDLAYARTRAVSEFLVAEGKISPEIVRLSIAAPAEAESLPRSPIGEPLYNRVVISSLESTPMDLENAGQ